MNTVTQNAKQRRALKIMLGSVLAIVLGATVLPLVSYVFSDPAAFAQQASQESNPRFNFWPAVREGSDYKGPAYSSVGGPESTVLINSGGETWRQMRNGPIATYGGWILAAAVVAICLFQMLRGTVKLEHTPGGERVQRWSSFERILHWTTAVLFIALAITGLSMLFGRAVLIPLLGAKGFAGWAQFSILVHNYIGPVFCATLLIEVLWWIRHNIPNAHDIEWFKQGGGLFSKDKHPHAGKMNGGEKLWFWIIVFAGGAVCITGLILDFPNFGQTRETMQNASLIHGVVATVWVAIALGHIYIGTLGTEGSFEGMAKGTVSKEWAMQHHDLWYEEITQQQTERQPVGGVSTAGTAAPRDSISS